MLLFPVRYGLEPTAHPKRKYVSTYLSLLLSSATDDSFYEILAEALLTSPGTIHQVSTTLIDGRLQRVYKNLWPSLRQFWLSAVSQYTEDTYIVFEHDRWTYRQVHDRAVKWAGIFVKKYDIQKGKYWPLEPVSSRSSLSVGDRVAICSRNCPEYLVAFWACRTLLVIMKKEQTAIYTIIDLIGAVSVLVNAFVYHFQCFMVEVKLIV